VQSYVDEVVEVTLANAEAGYIPREFTRDPAWYSDIRELVDQYEARIDDRVAAKLLERLERAERRGVAGSESAAIAFLKQVATRANRGIADDTAARDAVLRPTRALIALLRAAKDMERPGRH
jgi:hypothetical protein